MPYIAVQCIMALSAPRHELTLPAGRDGTTYRARYPSGEYRAPRTPTSGRRRDTGPTRRATGPSGQQGPMAHRAAQVCLLALRQAAAVARLGIGSLENTRSRWPVERSLTRSADGGVRSASALQPGLYRSALQVQGGSTVSCGAQASSSRAGQLD